MRQPLILMTLMGALATAPGLAQAQTAKDALEKVKDAEKSTKAPEKTKSEKEKAKADKEKAEKEKADKEKADKEKAEKEKADKEKAKDAGVAKDASVVKADAAAVDQASDEVDAEFEELKKTRGDRRKASIEKIRGRWGALLENPSSKDELTQHARRIAQLQRIRALAEAKKKVKLVEKVDELITKEELCHGKAMNKLRDAAGGAK